MTIIAQILILIYIISVLAIDCIPSSILMEHLPVIWRCVTVLIRTPSHILIVCCLLLCINDFSRICISMLIRFAWPWSPLIADPLAFSSLFRQNTGLDLIPPILKLCLFQHILSCYLHLPSNHNLQYFSFNLVSCL